MVALALVVGGCGTVDPELAETIASAPGADDTLATLPPVATGDVVVETTTTTPPEGGETGARNADAAALAAALEVGAVQLEETLAANGGLDPFAALIDASQNGADGYRAIPATAATSEVLADLAASGDALAELIGRYEPLLADPATAPAALQDFLAENSEIVEIGVEIEARLVGLVNDQLALRGGPVADYLVASADVQQEAGVVISELLDSMQLLGVDPVAALSAMRGPVETIGDLGPLIDQLDAPPSLEDYHRRYVAFLDEYAMTFGVLIDTAEASGSPTATDLRSMQSLGVQGPELNAERSRLLAAALRGELN